MASRYVFKLTPLPSRVINNDGLHSTLYQVYQSHVLRPKGVCQFPNPIRFCFPIPSPGKLTEWSNQWIAHH